MLMSHLFFLFFFTFLITPGVFLSLDTLANSSSFNTDDFLNFFTNKIDLIRDFKKNQKKMVDTPLRMMAMNSPTL